MLVCCAMKSGPTGLLQSNNRIRFQHDNTETVTRVPSGPRYVKIDMALEPLFW